MVRLSPRATDVPGVAFLVKGVKGHGLSLAVPIPI